MYYRLDVDDTGKTFGGRLLYVLYSRMCRGWRLAHRGRKWITIFLENAAGISDKLEETVSSVPRSFFWNEHTHAHTHTQVFFFFFADEKGAT